MFPGVFSGETRVHCWAPSPTASPKFRCSIVLGFHHSLSLSSDEVEGDESAGSNSEPDGKPGSVCGSGDGDGGGDGGGNGGCLKGICVLSSVVLALVAQVVVVLVRVLVVVIMACLVALGQAVVVVWEDQPWLDSDTQPFVQQKKGIIVPAGPFVLVRLVSDHTRGETPQWLQQLWLHHQ